jgi:hypothetical protein
VTDLPATIVPLNCFECAGPIEVACEGPAEPGESQTVRFECPYCGRPRELELPGKVLWVAMRQHGGTGPETRH